MRRALAVFVIFLVLGVATWIFFEDPKFLSDAGITANTMQTKRILVRDTLPLFVDIADSDVLRTEGLSGRNSLKDNTGLLMVFDEDTDAGIWMKDMRFPIDIIWLDSSGNVITVAKSVQPDTYPTTFYPARKARYVLEVQAGYSDINNIEEGVHIQL